MFSTDNLVYLELQKTGGTHILSLLEQYVGGTSQGKHHRIKDLDGKFMLGSIRNPWDWYVSLWAYGVSGKGAIRHRLTTGLDIRYYNRMLPHNMGKRWLTPYQYCRMCINDVSKPTGQWLRVYHDHNDPGLFREWLRMMLDHGRRHDVGEGYAFSPVSDSCGLLTYRYLRLYTLGNPIYTDRSLTTLDGVIEFDKRCNRSNYIIRNDSLVEDFIDAMGYAGIKLSEEQISLLRTDNQKRTNASKRKKAEYYYNDEALDLVAEREKFIIDKYRFSPPF